MEYIPSIIIGVLLLGLVSFIVYKMISDKKKGKSSCGCSGCSGCCGNCKHSAESK